MELLEALTARWRLRFEEFRCLAMLSRREVRIAEVVRDVGADAITECAAGRLLTAPSHLLVDGQVDDLGDGFGEHIGALGVDGGQLFDQPAGNSKHEPADTRRA